MDGVYKLKVDTLTQNKQTVQCKVKTESGESVKDASGRSDTEQRDGTV